MPATRQPKVRAFDTMTINDQTGIVILRRLSQFGVHCGTTSTFAGVTKPSSPQLEANWLVQEETIDTLDVRAEHRERPMWMEFGAVIAFAPSSEVTSQSESTGT